MDTFEIVKASSSVGVTRKIFWREHIRAFRSRLHARGYPDTLVNKTLSEVKFEERKLALQQKKRTYIKVHLTPNFFFLFSKRVHNVMKIKKNYANPLNRREFMEVWSLDFLVHDRMWGDLEPNVAVTSAGEPNSQLSCQWCDKSVVREISHLKTS